MFFISQCFLILLNQHVLVIQNQHQFSFDFTNNRELTITWFVMSLTNLPVLLILTMSI
jgi:hypothetical protein